jgi:hypothetical protein
MKSNESDFLELLQVVYIDACSRCTADVSDLRDLETIRSRVKHEGISFLTISLPNFCKSFERSLEAGQLDPTWFPSFRFHGRLPAFLRGFVGRVFNRETGRINIDETNEFSACEIATYIDAVRQICLLFKKVKFDCTKERTNQAFAEFIKIETELQQFSLRPEDAAEFSAVSSLLWHDCIYRLRDSVLSPRHGPGATSDGVSGNRKYQWGEWNERLDNYFPLFDCAYTIGAIGSEEAKIVKLIPQDSERPARVLAVPKTLKTPRIIAKEPSCMQYAQQGILRMLVPAIESYWLTKGHINFSDQTVNQKLAMRASKDGRLATIDLSEASDRVPRDLAMTMFDSYPELKDAILACRSTRAEIREFGAIVELSKFASMGSALCFPVESMYFYTICVAALLKEQNLPVTPGNIHKVSRDVYVYGDDIVVPADAASVVFQYLQKYNCKVNTSKSFSEGNFRESCGVDAFKGISVTPVYLRERVPKHKRNVAELISWSATGNLLYKKGYFRAAEFMHTKCERILGVYPEVPEESSALGRIYRFGKRNVVRLYVPRRGKKGANPLAVPDYQCPEIRAWVAEPVYRTDRLDGYAALVKCLQSLEDRSDSPVSRDALHLERSALREAVALKLRWVPAT